MIVVGIDSGLTGAVSFSVQNRWIVELTPTIKVGSKRRYDRRQMRHLLEDIRRYSEPESSIEPIHVFIEKTQAMPKQGRTSMHSIGYGFGLWVMACECILGVTVHEVAPAVWHKVMCSDAPPGKPKERALFVASQMWGRDFLIPEGCRVPHSGIVDALLIGEYGFRLSKQEQP